MEKRILITGIGGVGGILAGPLVRQYKDAVTLMARGARKQALLEKGLVLHSDLYGEFTVRPALVTEDPSSLPVQDFVLVCVKNGGLAAAARQLRPAVGPDTVVVPVMNGVTAAEVLRRELGTGLILSAAIYTVSLAEADHSIRQKGNYTYLTAGGRPGEPREAAAARAFSALLEGAGIRCTVSEDAAAAIWAKYILNCAYNTATARWGTTIGTISSDPALLADCRALMEEAAAVARAKGVHVEDGLVERHLHTIAKTATPDSDSSLSRDFAAGRAGEMDVFSTYIIREGERLGVPVPVSARYGEALREIASHFAPA